MTVKGYMFDFSGTLMRVEPTADWLDAVLDDLGIEATARERAGCAARLERLGALPGGVSPRSCRTVSGPRGSVATSTPAATGPPTSG